jgi:Copper type II ascorbate-dependent monooxygenase, C-terminal domain
MMGTMNTKRAIALSAMTTMILAGCGSDEAALTPDDPDGLLAPPAAGLGVQYKMKQSIEAGQDIEYCLFTRAPAEGLLINSQDVRYTQGSHHVLLMTTSYEEIPEDAPEGIFECDGFGDWDVISLVGGAQSQKSAFMENIPADVAVEVPPNAVLIMNTHYLNTAPDALEAEARINLYTIPESEVNERAGVLFWYNFVATVEPQGTGSANAMCPLQKDITVLDMQSHMHARGTNFEANLLDGKRGEKVETLYENTEWEEVPVKFFEPAKSLGADQWIEWKCEYENPEDRFVAQGVKATDEMCVLFGTYYPYDENVEFCSTEGGIDNWMLQSEISGTGSETCDATLSCIIAADDLFDPDYQKCLTDSCSGAAQQVTDIVKCHATDGWDAACDGDLACLLNACNTEIVACQEALCE